MKVLISPGVELIRYSRHVSVSSGGHDPWPSHAVLWGGAEAWFPAGGVWFFGNIFKLADGHTYEYGYGPFGPPPDGYSKEQDFEATQSTFVSGSSVGAYGEWFNYVVRPGNVIKIRIA